MDEGEPEPATGGTRDGVGRPLAVAAALATIAAAVLAALGLTNDIFPFRPSPSGSTTAQSSPQLLPPSTIPGEQLDLRRDVVEQLGHEVQVDRFVDLLGEPDGKTLGREGRFQAWRWVSTDGVVTAFIDSVDQVRAYSVIAHTSQLAVEVPIIAGGRIRLTMATFSDMPIEAVEVDGNYPPSARWFYEERYGNGFELQYQTVVIGAGYAASSGANEPPISDVIDCLQVSNGCPEVVDFFRRSNPIHAFAVGSIEAIDAIERDELMLIPYFDEPQI